MALPATRRRPGRIGCGHERRRRNPHRGHPAGHDNRHHHRGLRRKPVAAAGAVPDTTLTTPSGEVGAYLAVPSGDPPWPGVVVIHEAFGLNADVRAHADRFAGRGYVALAPDLFSFRRPKAMCALAAFRALNKRSGPAFDAIEAARTALADRSDATGRVGIIGFCMGGGFALLAAPRGWFDASSVNYGAVPKDAEALLRGACPIVGS